MNWRNHPRLVLPGLGAMALAGLVVCLSGCGGKATVAAKPPPTAADQSGKPKKVWMDDCPEPKDWGREPAPPKPPAPARPAAPPPSRRPVAMRRERPRRAKRPSPSDPATWPTGNASDYYSAQTGQRPAIGGRRRLPGQTFPGQAGRRRTAGQAAGIAGRHSGRGGPDESPADAESETHRGRHCRAGRQRHAAGPADARTPRDRKPQNRRTASHGNRRREGHSGASLSGERRPLVPHRYCARPAAGGRVGRIPTCRGRRARQSR